MEDTLRGLCCEISQTVIRQTGSRNDLIKLKTFSGCSVSLNTEVDVDSKEWGFSSLPLFFLAAQSERLRRLGQAGSRPGAPVLCRVRRTELGGLVLPRASREGAAEAGSPIHRVSVLATWGCTACSLASPFLLQACVFVLGCVRNETLIGAGGGGGL